MSALTDLLLHGTQTANSLRQRLGVSQATFSRLVNTESDVIKAGAARATQYALIRPVRQIRQFPLWQIDDAGQAWRFGDLYPILPRDIWLEMLIFARQFWLEASQNQEISPAFRELCRGMALQLDTVEASIKRLA